MAGNAAVASVKAGLATVVSGSFRPGETLGRYRVVQKIGSGGFGAVYRGFDPILRRDVAVKTCELPSLEVRARFEREARLASRLRHPSITTVYDFGLEGDIPFLVCEFLEGMDLDETLYRRPDMSLLEKLDILIAVAAAIECAHTAGVLHRDIKPGNVRVLSDGSVKLMDFGIAKSLFFDEHLTRAGITIGSSSYMSPEQARGEPLDPRTDLFSFGVLAYELLAGRRPFRDSDPMRLLEKIATEEPDRLGRIDPDLPPSLAALVHGCLSKEAAARPSSAGELGLALRSAQAEMLILAGLAPSPFASEEPRIESGSRRARFPARVLHLLRGNVSRFAAALLLLLAAGLMLSSWGRDEGRPRQTPQLASRPAPPASRAPR